MKRLVWGVLGIVVLITTVFLAPPATAEAAEGFNVITSPLPVKIVTQPGKTVETELRIKNQSNLPEGIKVGLMRFGATGESGQPNLFDLTPKDTFASWVHFSPAKFIAQPNVWNTIKMTINVPSDAGLGYYLAVTFSPSNQPGGRDVTNLKGSAATLILLDVKSPNEKRSLKLVDFSTDHKLYEYLPSTFRIKLHNDGNIYLPPSGNIFIQRGNSVIDTLDFNAAGGSVLPQSNRVFNLPWKNGFPHYVDVLKNSKPVNDKHGQPKQSLRWDFTQVNKLRFGKYTAKLLIAYDDGVHDVPIESTLSFWVIPWKIILFLLVIVAIIGFGIFTLLRSITRRVRPGRLSGKHKRDKKI